MTQEGYNSGAYSAVHETDFVGRTPLIAGRLPIVVGGNKATGGVGGWFKYSHSSYYVEIPKQFIIDKNGKEIENLEHGKFVRMWGKPINGINPSLPILVYPTKDRENKGKYHEKPF